MILICLVAQDPNENQQYPIRSNGDTISYNFYDNTKELDKDKKLNINRKYDSVYFKTENEDDMNAPVSFTYMLL